MWRLKNNGGVGNCACVNGNFRSRSRPSCTSLSLSLLAQSSRLTVGSEIKQAEQEGAGDAVNRAPDPRRWDNRMTRLSAASLKLNVVLFIFGLAYLVGPLWWPHVEYNDVGPSPMFLVALLAVGGQFSIPVCVLPAGVLAVVAIVRDTRKLFGIISLLLCISTVAMWVTGKQIEEKRKESQQSHAGDVVNSAPDA